MHWEWTHRWLVRGLKHSGSFLYNVASLSFRECQHRWPEVVGMVEFYNKVGESGMNNWVSGTKQQIAFGRGTAPFYFAIRALDDYHINRCSE
jgi:hypothetical protein